MTHPGSRRLALFFMGAALISSAASAGAQTRDPEAMTFTLVSEYGPPIALFVNPAVVGIMRHRTSFMGQMTWDRPKDGKFKLGQYLAGLQAKMFGFGYQHDDFAPGHAFAQGDVYTVVMGGGRGNAGFGGSFTWRTVGDSDPSWVLGSGYATRTTSLGFVWRDIGSPVVRDTVRESRIISGLTVKPSEGRFTLSAELDYSTQRSKIRTLRFGGGLAAARKFRFQALLGWDGDGNFLGFLLSGRMRLGKEGAAFGAAKLDSGGDAGSGTLGLDFTSSPSRRR